MCASWASHFRFIAEFPCPKCWPVGCWRRYRTHVGQGHAVESHPLAMGGWGGGQAHFSSVCTGLFPTRHFILHSLSLYYASQVMDLLPLPVNTVLWNSTFCCQEDTVHWTVYEILIETLNPDCVFGTLSDLSRKLNRKSLSLIKLACSCQVFYYW